MNAAEIIARFEYFLLAFAIFYGRNFQSPRASFLSERGRTTMDFGKGALLWLLGVPLPTILFLALFWHH
jgi:hypothetical protein